MFGGSNEVLAQYSVEFNDFAIYSVEFNDFAEPNASTPNTVSEVVRQTLHITLWEKVCEQTRVLYILNILKEI